MATRRHFIARAAAVMLFILACWGSPAGLQAQDDRCICDHYTITVGPKVSCKINILWALSPIDRLRRSTIEPGGKLDIPCPLYVAYIQTCRGSYQILPIDPAGRICSGAMNAESGCCIRACYVRTSDGCQGVDIQPADCASDDC